MNKSIASLLIVLTCFSCTDNSNTENQSNTSQNVVAQLESEKRAVETISPQENMDSISQEAKILIEDVIEAEDIVLDEIVDDIIELKTNHEYINYNVFLQEHVSSNGKVNYSKIKQNLNRLAGILLFFETNSPNSTWTKNEQLCYWINAYNAYTLYFVSQKYPVKSILDINSKPWDVKFIPSGNDKISLNDIEHKKIRAKFNEPRIHFALNCASESCPQLLNKAYKPSNLQELLKKQTMHFLNDVSKNNLRDTLNIEISSLFDWYKEDFSKNDQTVISFIQRYNPNISVDVKIQYMEYSWKLND